MDKLKFSITLSVKEFLAIYMMLTLGKMFTKPKYRRDVECVLSRIAKKLEKLGMPHEAADRISKL